MKSTYDPQTLERHWYQLWEKSGYFTPSGKGEAYCIMLPPPNVTGTLHMGHGFQQTLMDALIRYHRMRGFNTLWQVGTDHAGIATQMVVERQLLQQGQSRHDLGRDAFEERVWEWKNQSDSTIKSQMRRLGVSTDWSRERFTMDKDISQAVMEVFVQLYEEGLIYRGKRLVNWDPVLHTAVSDLEVINEPRAGQLYYIRYPFIDGSGHIVVATTRPETLFGDVAVAVNPEDERYRQVIGKQLRLPLTERTIPIIADASVLAEFGTGCVKITPAHDFNDNAMGQRHHLPMLNIFTPDAKLNDQVPKTYQGLDRFKAREQIIKELTAQELIEKIEPYTVSTPIGDRSGAVLEPYLTDQWYMAMSSLAEPAMAAVKDHSLKFVPEQWSKTYLQWLENIQDWCISRQLWWGHRIPAWYDDQGNVYVAHSETEARQKHSLPENLKLRQDDDVLDTWFSAALWPFATLGWPSNTAELKTFYPTSVLITGFDIIFFWVARMVMMGLKFTNNIPFHEVYITGLIRDAEGQKMSKSKGNVLDPIDLIDGIALEDLIAKRTSGLMQPAMAKRIADNTRKEFPNGIPAFGTDALRFTFCALTTTGRDIRFDLARIEGYRNFCNKLWNAARYVLMNTTEHTIPTTTTPEQWSLTDRWIMSRLQDTIERVYNAFAQYRFDLLAHAIYEFTWNEYCDWYLEFSKPILTGQTSDDVARGVTRHTLLTVLETLLRLAHPLMPFITEEIWQQVAPLLGKQSATIMLQSYPTLDARQRNLAAENEIAWLQKVIVGVRNIRGEMNISPKLALPILVKNASAKDLARLQQHRALLTTLAKIDSLRELAPNEAVPPSATAIVDELELHIPMAGLIDINAESARLQKEIGKQQKELEQLSGKLQNVNYVERAPAEVVARDRNRVAELELAIVKLKQQLERLATITV